METITKFTAIQIRENKINDTVKAKLIFAESGEHNTESWSNYFDYETEHDSEEEAIKYAFKENKDASWLILPIVKFK